MAKKHKNLDNILIQWDGDLSKPVDGSAQSSPDNIDIVWGGYTPVWYPDCYDGITFNQSNCASGVMSDPVYFEDYDINKDGVLDSGDRILWNYAPAGVTGHADRADIGVEIRNIMTGGTTTPDKAPKTTYTWGDVAFVLEIFDGIGTGSRRSREARLQQLDKDKKKRLIRLICRVKGEKVYDEKKEVGDIQIKLEDAELVIEKVLGKMRVENTNVL